MSLCGIEAQVSRVKRSVIGGAVCAILIGAATGALAQEEPVTFVVTVGPNGETTLGACTGICETLDCSGNSLTTASPESALHISRLDRDNCTSGPATPEQSAAVIGAGLGIIDTLLAGVPGPERIRSDTRINEDTTQAITGNTGTTDQSVVFPEQPTSQITPVTP